MHRVTLLGGGLLMAALALFLVFSGGNNDQADALTPPAGDIYVCFDISPAFPAPVSVTLTTQFDNGIANTFGSSELYCEEAAKDTATEPPPDTTPELICYPITNDPLKSANAARTHRCRTNGLDP